MTLTTEFIVQQIELAVFLLIILFARFGRRMFRRRDSYHEFEHERVLNKLQDERLKTQQLTRLVKGHDAKDIILNPWEFPEDK